MGVDDGGAQIPVRVFISYRREDTRGYAGRLYDSLLQRLAPGQVFMDIDNIEPGVDFVDVLTETVERADVELVLIGPQWIDMRNARGQRRLDDPNDYVRLETEAALRRGIRVIPILFGGAVMPSADELPPSLAALSRRNALEISDGRWRFDVGRLLDAIDAVGRSQAAAAPPQVEPMEPEPAPLEPPVVAPAPAEEPIPQDLEIDTEVAPVPAPVAATPPPPGNRRRLILLGGAGLGGAAAVAVAATFLLNPGSPGPNPSPTPTGSAVARASTGASATLTAPIDVTITVDMPTGGLAERLGWAVELAVADRAEELLAAGFTVSVTTFTHGVDNEPNADAGVANAEAFVADPSVVAMVGPRNTKIAVPQLPITNAASLPQCGPGTGYPPLTRVDAGALDLRSARPDRPNYFRPVASDDLEGSAAAQWAREVLLADTAFVVTDMSEFGDHLSDGFRDGFTEVGGTPAPRVDFDPAAGDYAATVALIGTADVVFLGTDQTPVTAAFRRAMVDAGLGAVTLLAGSSIVHSPGAAADSYFKLAGDAATGTYASAGGPMVAAGMADFSAAYLAAHGEEPGSDEATGYACGQVLVQALLETSPADDDLREAVRAQIVGSGATFDTVLGTMGFDANGDTLEPVTRILRVDPTGDGGAGDWALDVEIDYPPPTDLADALERAD